jgi:hypothetical protein
LTLRNVPVPAERPKVADVGLNGTDAGTSAGHRWKTWLNQFGPVRFLKRQAFRLAPWEPFPEYKSASHPGWQLMAAIIRRFQKVAGHRPLVIVPVFYAAYLYQNMARNYLNRFKELAGQLSRVHVLDLMPSFQVLGPAEGRKCFFDPHDAHFSPQGHLVLADALEHELARLGILSKTESAEPC